MNLKNRFLITLLLCSVIRLPVPLLLQAQTAPASFIKDELPQLKKLSADLNQNVLPLLALVKEYEKYGPPPSVKVAKILRTSISVRETDNQESPVITEARINEEYPVIDESDKWYKIRTADNREGWIPEESVQILMKLPAAAGNETLKASGQETSALLGQMARYKINIDELYAEAGTIIRNIEQEYNRLSPEDKASVADEYKTFAAERDKIEKYHQYVVKYLSPYTNLLILPGAPQSHTIAKGERFHGIVSADLGRSSYENNGSNSTTSRRLTFDGNYQIDKATRLKLMINHQNELVQTAFTSNTVEAGISRQFGDKFLIGSNAGYDSYKDKFTDNNSFGVFRAGLNTLFTPVKKVSFSGNLNFQSKDFKETDENNYQSLIYSVGTNIMANPRSNIRIQVQGNKQLSSRDYLDFSQVSPRLIYTYKKNPEKIFSIDLDYDQLKYSGNSNFNDYGKYKTAFQWRNINKTRTLTNSLDFIYKQFPNNGRQDYLRIGHRTERRKGSLRDEKSSVSSVQFLLTVITMRQDNNLTDFFDLRWDKTKLRPKWYSSSNLYLKLFNNIEKMIADSTNMPDHFIDFYREFGPSFRNVSDGNVRISSLKFGIILGGHVYFNFDEDYFNRNGNSLRGGLAVSTNINIYKASLAAGGSYERSLIISKETSYNPYNGELIYGDNIYRKPSSFQFNIDFRQPVGKSWDIHFNLGTYNIRTDATFETSINPVEKKSNLRLSGGIIYRFAL